MKCMRQRRGQHANTYDPSLQHHGGMLSYIVPIRFFKRDSWCWGVKQETGSALVSGGWQ
jgi:hypothetical protein